MSDVAPPPDLDLAALIERVDRKLLGGPRELTRADVAERAGLPPERARELWRALGFANVDDDERAFTDGDVAALGQVHQLTEQMSLDDDLLRAMTRMLGRSFSRLASWQGQLAIEVLGRSPELLHSEDDVIAFLDTILDTMSELQTYVWHRQLAAYFTRLAANASAGAGEQTTMAVGFADLAQFTALTRRSSEADLRAVLEDFETAATDVVSEHGGQIVKTIGDEVLFVADTAVDGARIALDLLDATAASERLPELRVGLAFGPVVSRLGDVFGATVNIASRLTSLSRAGAALVDDGVHNALADDDAFRFSALRPASVRGYHHLRSWRLRSAT